MRQCEVGDEAAEHRFPLAGSEDRARVDRGDHRFREIGVRQPAPIPSHSEASAEEGLSGGRSEENEDFGRNHRQFPFEPRPTGELLRPGWLVVDPACSSCLPLEMFDGVGQ